MLIVKTLKRPIVSRKVERAELINMQNNLWCWPCKATQRVVLKIRSFKIGLLQNKKALYHVGKSRLLKKRPNLGAVDWRSENGRNVEILEHSQPWGSDLLWSEHTASYFKAN